MALIIPQLDDRTYRDILNEAIARIPVHTPEWTNFSDADPGITILQLFAFMQENLLFRGNLIPERNRLNFLKLLGVPVEPATAANGVVVFTNENGPLQSLTLPAGLPVFAGKTGFLTQNGLDILPVDAQLFTRRRLEPDEEQKADATYRQLFETFTDPQTDLQYYETVPFEPGAGAGAVDLADNTVDRSLWIALLKRRADRNADATSVLAELERKTVTIGLMPFVEQATRKLPPGGTRAERRPAPLSFEIATGRLVGGVPFYAPLDVRFDDDPFENLTIVQAMLPAATEMGTWLDLDPLEDGVGDYPPSLEDEAVRTNVVTWIRIRLAKTEAETASAIRARFSWAGINAARVSQRVQVFGERVGDGSGEPDQKFALVNTPVIPESVVLFVGADLWTRTDDLVAAPPEVPDSDSTAQPGDPRVFTVDRESGEIACGTGLNGARFPRNAPIIANYAYGGGRAGNVGIGALKNSSDLPPGFKVLNPLPTWGGDDGETVDEAERQIPKFLRHRDRAVTADDFQDIVSRTPGVDLGRVEVVPLFHPELETSVPGVVTVMVIPFDLTRPESPEPDRFFLDAVCDYLEPRRVLTTEVYVYGPTYVGLSVSVGIDVVAGRDIAVVREAVKAEIRKFLSPLVGGPEGAGWPLNKVVEDRELFAVATRVPGVTKVRDVRMWDEARARRATLELDGLRLPRLNSVQVSFGDADDLMATPQDVPKKRLPVPVLPAEC